MEQVLVEEGYRIVLPSELRAGLKVGTRLSVRMDEAGRIILVPESQARAILMETFGMWADRQDTPPDGVTYMDQMRKGSRLDELGLAEDETD